MFWKKKRTTPKALVSEESKPSKDKKSLITGMIVGGAVGSVMSLLFAPNSGKATRERVAQKGKDLYEKGKSKAEIFIESYNQRVKKQIGE